MSVQRSITVALELQGWHSWPDATPKRNYLAALHRHLFNVEVTVEVFHNDRDVEFHDLRDVVTKWWGDQHSQEDRGSCEGIASQLHDFFAAYLSDGRRITVSVGEDGEAWATVSMPRGL